MRTQVCITSSTVPIWRRVKPLACSEAQIHIVRTQGLPPSPVARQGAPDLTPGPLYLAHEAVRVGDGEAGAVATLGACLCTGIRMGGMRGEKIHMVPLSHCQSAEEQGPPSSSRLYANRVEGLSPNAGWPRGMCTQQCPLMATRNVGILAGCPAQVGCGVRHTENGVSGPRGGLGCVHEGVCMSGCAMHSSARS